MEPLAHQTRNVKNHSKKLLLRLRRRSSFHLQPQTARPLDLDVLRERPDVLRKAFFLVIRQFVIGTGKLDLRKVRELATQLSKGTEGA